MAEEIQAARQKALALAKERKPGGRVAPDYQALLAARRAQEKSEEEKNPARKDKESTPLKPRIIGKI